MKMSSGRNLSISPSRAVILIIRIITLAWNYRTVSCMTNSIELNSEPFVHAIEVYHNCYKLYNFTHSYWEEAETYYSHLDLEWEDVQRESDRLYDSFSSVNDGESFGKHGIPSEESSIQLKIQITISLLMKLQEANRLLSSWIKINQDKVESFQNLYVKCYQENINLGDNKVADIAKLTPKPGEQENPEHFSEEGFELMHDMFMGLAEVLRRMQFPDTPPPPREMLEGGAVPSAKMKEEPVLTAEEEFNQGLDVMTTFYKISEPELINFIPWINEFFIKITKTQENQVFITFEQIIQAAEYLKVSEDVSEKLIFLKETQHLRYIYEHAEDESNHRYRENELPPLIEEEIYNL